MKSFRNLGIKNGLNAIFIITTTTLFVGIFGYYWLDEKNELIENIEKIQLQAMNDQKSFLKSEVNHVINYINYHRKSHRQQPDSIKQTDILKYIETIRFKQGGYVFVNTYQGQALVFDGKIMEDYIDVSNMTDPDGKKLFELELSATKKPGGEFMEYKFKELGEGGKVQPKLSYMKGFNDWQWIIGAGFYLQDLNDEIHTLQNDYNAELKSELLRTSLVFLLLNIILITFGWHFSNRLNHELSLFKELFSNYSKKGQIDDVSKFKFADLKMLALSINQMLLQKKESDQKLKESEEQYRSLIEQAGDAIIKCDIAGTILSCNSASIELTGFMRNELIGNPISILFSKKQLQDKPLDYTSIQKGKTIVVERFITTKDGNQVAVEMNTRKVQDKYLVSIFRDISVRKATEQELAKYRDNLEKLVKERTKQLEEKNKELENFNELFVGREFRIKELREKVKALESDIIKQNKEVKN